jgi:5-methylthioadenosine/S-adenosylhomocysteine deaminase
MPGFMKKRQSLTSLLLVLFLVFSTIAQSRRKSSASLDLLIIGGTVVTMDQDRTIIENGAIAIKDGKILSIGKASGMRGRRARQTINASGKVIIPGLINTHTHVPMVLFRGISDDLDLNDWLTRFIFPAEARNVDEAFVRAGTRLGLAEMIRGGTTTYCDMYYFEDAIADETKRVGMRGVLGETVLDFPAPDNKTWDAAMAYSERFINKWRNDPLIVPAIAPHAPYTVSPEHLRETRRLADRLGVPLLIHLAEADTETRTIIERHRMRPIEFVESIGLLSGKTIAAHVVHANEAELDILKRRETGIGHCPQSNMKLASGVSPVPAMVAKRMRVGLGTDGAASNNDLNMWEEIDTAAKVHKLHTGDPKTLPAETAFELATIGAARALHMEKQIGSIESGKMADLAIVDLDSLHQTPRYSIYSHLVYATKASDVSSVIVGGRILMLNRRLLTLNESVIKRDANAYRSKIINSLSQ